MKQKHRADRDGKMTDEQKNMLTIIIIPLIVIVLMVIIVIADHNGTKDEKTETAAERVEEPETMPAESLSAEAPSEEETEPESEAEPETVQETDPADAFITETFQRDSSPEILELMKTYFNARAGADAETMNRIYGVDEVSVSDLEVQKAHLRSNSKYVQGFENVATYVMNGTTADAWLVYAVTDIRFHSVKTAAPMIMWCYVNRDAEGTYHIQNNDTLSENILRFIDAAKHSEPVRRLASDVNNRLKKALSEDADLNEVYGVLRDGSPVWQDGEEQDIVVIEKDESNESTVENGTEAAVLETSGS